MSNAHRRYGSVNRWLSARFLLLSSVVVALTAFVCVMTPGIDASLAGFALAFASSLLGDVSPPSLLMHTRWLTRSLG